jgi:Xaa-Pro aminopeptidase
MIANTLLPAPNTPEIELSQRLDRLRREMERRNLDAVVLSSRQNFEYWTGYQSLSWAYQARPLFAVVTHGDMTVIGSTAERRNIEQQARLFEVAYYNGFAHEAAEAVVDLIAASATAGGNAVAIDWSQDNLGRGSLDLIDGLRARNAGGVVTGAGDAIWRVRMIKSPFEAELKRASFKIVNAAFDAAISEAHLGVTERQLQRSMQSKIILDGAERADPIAMLFSKGDFIYNRPAGERALEAGHYIWTDFRSTYGGYPADRNRIARAGEPEPWEVDTYRKVRGLTIALCNSIRAGMTGADAFRNFERLWADAALGPIYGAVSRVGHGGGLEVTEPPSIMPSSREVIEEGMILHLEPKLETNGAVFQFEEIIYVGDNGVTFLSDLSPEQCPLILR